MASKIKFSTLTEVDGTKHDISILPKEGAEVLHAILLRKVSVKGNVTRAFRAMKMPIPAWVKDGKYDRWSIIATGKHYGWNNSHAKLR